VSNLFSLVNKTRARRNTEFVTWFIDINVHMPSRVSDVFYLNSFYSFFVLVLDFSF